MKLTQNLKIYIILNLVTTTLFYWLTVFNDVGVERTKNADGTETISTSMPLLWLLIFFVSFLLLYKTDNIRGTRSNLGFAYHVAATVIVLLPVIAMLILWPFTSYGFDPFLLLPIAALSVSLLIHWFFTRKDPKGIEGKKVFK